MSEVMVCILYEDTQDSSKKLVGLACLRNSLQ